MYCVWCCCRSTKTKTLTNSCGNFGCRFFFGINMRSVVIKKGHTSDISIDEVMSHCRVEDDEEKPLLQIYLDAAIDVAEQKTNRLLAPSTVVSISQEYRDVFYIPYGQLIDITKVECIDPYGDTVTVTDFDADFINGAVRVPAIYSNHRSFTFSYSCGFADGELPKAIKQGILMTVMTLYNTREDISYGLNAVKVPRSSEYLFNLYRLPSSLGG